MRKAVREIKLGLHELEAEMQQLCNDYAAQHRSQPGSPRVANLVVRRERTAELRVMWRAPGRRGQGQAFFSLLDSDHGRTLLADSTPPVRADLLAYEQRRSDLNLTYGLAFTQLRRLRSYLEWLDLYSDQSDR